MVIYFCILVILLLYLLYIQRQALHKYKLMTIKEKSLLAGVTHDLKTPTSAQINMLNLLLKGQFGKLNPEQYEMIKLTCGSSKYVSNLVNTILTGYETETNSLKLNITKFDITQLIEKICTQNKFLLANKEQTIIFNCHNSINVFADKLQIERVIYNLLSNAINYGNKKSTIIINLKKEYYGIKFSITNKSKHISTKELKNIFKKFSKTENSLLNNDSHGLGLYVAKNIIDLHHGMVYAKSLPDGTCIFGFRLKDNPYKDKSFVKSA